MPPILAAEFHVDCAPPIVEAATPEFSDRTEPSVPCSTGW